MKTIRVIAWVAVAAVAIFILGSRFMTGQQASESLGGPFVLTSQTGERLSSETLRGRYLLIYFGYSFCPDVCPIELAKLSAAITQLEAEGFDVTPLQPLFISVDPERDTPEALADYMVDFHPSFIALTGTPEEIADVAQKYRVYYKKREQEGIDGYLMDHQSVIVVMGPDGKFQRLFSSRHTPADIVEALKPVLKKVN